MRSVRRSPKCPARSIVFTHWRRSVATAHLVMPSNARSMQRSEQAPRATVSRSSMSRTCRSRIYRATRRAFGCVPSEHSMSAEQGYLLVEDDLRPLSIGAALLGTGGGGNPYIGMLRAREVLRKGAAVR